MKFSFVIANEIQWKFTIEPYFFLRAAPREYLFRKVRVKATKQAFDLLHLAE